MRILYLSSVRVPSEKASGLAIFRQCEGLQQCGYDATLHVPKRRDSETVEQAYGSPPNFNLRYFKSVELFFLGKVGLIFMYFYETLRVLLFYFFQTKSPDVIFTRDKFRALPFIFLGLGKKVVAEIHQVHHDPLTRFVAKKSNKIVVISQGLREFYSNISDRDDIIVEPSGVYLKQFEKLPDEQELRQQMNLPAEQIIFGYIGKMKTIGQGKGVEEIITAFAECYKTNSNTFLLLAGAEPDEVSDLESRLFSADVPVSAFAITELDQSRFAEYLKACDVLLMNYPNQEHYVKYMSPIKMFAYLASGKPIISSDLPTIREIDGVEGMLYAEADNTEEFARRMIEAVEDLSTLKSQAVTNIELAKTFSWDKRGKRIISST